MPDQINWKRKGLELKYAKQERQRKEKQAEFNALRDRVLSVISEAEYYYLVQSLQSDDSLIDAFEGMNKKT